MTTIKAGTMEVRGTAFEVELSGRDHRFQTYLDGEAVAAPSWGELYDLLFRVTARHATTISVPITELRKPCTGNAATRRGTIVGVHGGTGNPIVAWENEPRREQISYAGPFSLGYAPELTDEQARTWEELWAASDSAHKALSEFQRDHQLSPKEAANAAVSEALKKAQGTTREDQQP